MQESTFFDRDTDRQTQRKLVEPLDCQLESNIDSVRAGQSRTTTRHVIRNVWDPFRSFGSFTCSMATKLFSLIYVVAVGALAMVAVVVDVVVT